MGNPFGKVIAEAFYEDRKCLRINASGKPIYK